MITDMKKTSILILSILLVISIATGLYVVMSKPEGKLSLSESIFSEPDTTLKPKITVVPKEYIIGEFGVEAKRSYNSVVIELGEETFTVAGDKYVTINAVDYKLSPSNKFLFIFNGSVWQDGIRLYVYNIEKRELNEVLHPETGHAFMLNDESDLQRSSWLSDGRLKIETVQRGDFVSVEAEMPWIVKESN